MRPESSKTLSFSTMREEVAIPVFVCNSVTTSKGNQASESCNSNESVTMAPLQRHRDVLLD